MTASSDYTHCPNCLAEYRAGYTLCVDCGSLLVPGPSPAQAEPPGGQPAGPGRIEFATAQSPETEEDRFALEELPVVLTSIVEEDVDAFLAALDEQEIGARRGEPTGDGGVEIVVHAANLIDAQAVLVEFTGDVRLVDEIGVDPEGFEVGDDMAVVTWTRLQDAGAQASRLSERGVDVRIELPVDGDAAGARASILVRADDLERARAILGITR